MIEYEYLCPSCGVIEVEHRISEKLEVCPRCRSSVTRLISGPTHVIFNAGPSGGWSSDGYGWDSLDKAQT